MKCLNTDNHRPTVLYQYFRIKAATCDGGKKNDVDLPKKREKKSPRFKNRIQRINYLTSKDG